MTSPGREAMREAARLEAAAFYTRAAGDYTLATRENRATLDDALLAAALERVTDRRTIGRSIELGATVHDLMRQYHLTRAEAREAVAAARPARKAS